MCLLSGSVLCRTAGGIVKRKKNSEMIALSVRTVFHLVYVEWFLVLMGIVYDFNKYEALNVGWRIIYFIDECSQCSRVAKTCLNDTMSYKYKLSGSILLVYVIHHISVFTIFPFSKSF